MPLPGAFDPRLAETEVAVLYRVVKAGPRDLGPCEATTLPGR